MSFERILSRESHEFGSGANHDVGLEAQLTCDRRPKSGFVDIFAHDERSDRTNVNDFEFRQVLRDLRRTAAVRRSYIHGSQKNNGAHANWK